MSEPFAEPLIKNPILSLWNQDMAKDNHPILGIRVDILQRFSFLFFKVCHFLVDFFQEMSIAASDENGWKIPHGMAHHIALQEC